MVDIESVNQTLENLKRRRFEAYYCASAEEAKNLALSLIPENDVVAWGGSRTAEQIGLIDAVKEKFAVIDRDKATTPEEKRALMKKGLTADTFIAGVNGISRDGWLVNIDGTDAARAIMNEFPQYTGDVEILKGTMDDVFLNVTGRKDMDPEEGR